MTNQEVVSGTRRNPPHFLFPPERKSLLRGQERRSYDPAPFAGIRRDLAPIPQGGTPTEESTSGAEPRGRPWWSAWAPLVERGDGTWGRCGRPILPRSKWHLSHDGDNPNANRARPEFGMSYVSPLMVDFSKYEKPTRDVDPTAVATEFHRSLRAADHWSQTLMRAQAQMAERMTRIDKSRRKRHLAFVRAETKERWSCRPTKKSSSAKPRRRGGSSMPRPVPLQSATNAPLTRSAGSRPRRARHSRDASARDHYDYWRTNQGNPIIVNHLALTLSKILDRLDALEGH